MALHSKFISQKKIPPVLFYYPCITLTNTTHPLNAKDLSRRSIDTFVFTVPFGGSPSWGLETPQTCLGQLQGCELITSVH